MKNLIILGLLISGFVVEGTTQITFGIKGGVSPSIAPNTYHTIANRTTPGNEFTFNVVSVENGITFGAFADLDLDPNFFLRTEVLYNQYETTYQLRYTWPERERASNEVLYTERSKRLDIPVSLGARLGNFEVTSGLVGRIVINNENQMDQLEGFEEALSTLQFGLQAGIGMNIQNLNIGLTYQMDMTNYGEHIYVNSNSLDLQNSPTRLVATIGYRF